MTAVVSGSSGMIDRLRIDAFRIPTDMPESDGTPANAPWDLLEPVDGYLRPDLQRAENGLAFPRQDAERYAL